MSTKTTFKRIALVAVSALGIGLLSAIPSQAVSGLTVTATDGTATIQQADSTTAGTINIAGTVDALDSITVQALLVSAPTGATSSSVFYNLDSGTPTLSTVTVDTRDVATVPNQGVALSGVINKFSTAANGGGTVDTAAATSSSGASKYYIRVSSSAAAYVNYTFGFQLDTSTGTSTRLAGTYTYQIIVKSYNKGSSGNTAFVADNTINKTINIVVSDAVTASSGTAAVAGKSTAVMSAASSNAWQQTDIDSTVSGSSLAAVSSTGATAVIRVIQKTSTGLLTNESITASTTIGSIGDCTPAVVGASVKLKASSTGTTDVCVYPGGKAGVATISIATTSVTFTSKQVTFYSTTVSKISAALLGTTLGNSSTAIILAKAYDADNVQIVGNSSVYAYSDALTVINTGTSTGTECTYNATYGGHVCSLTGAGDGTAKITLRNKSTVALSTVTSTDVLSITVSTQNPATVKLAFDKASYAPGEKAYIRLWALDAAGKVVSGGTKTNLLATGGVSSSVAFGNGSDTTTSVNPVLGFQTTGYVSQDPIALYTVYMPSSGGTVTITATGGSLLPLAGQVAVTASATVTDNGASALAAVTALASQVSAFITKINAQITTLTDLVMKIQKKVKA